MIDMDFEQELKLFYENLEAITKKILDKFVAFTGLPIPQSYVLPPVEFSREEKIMVVGEKPNYATVLKKLEELKGMLGSTEATGEITEGMNSFFRAVEIFVELQKKDFDEFAFEALDKQWLALKYNVLYQDERYDKLRFKIQQLMEVFYGREYHFIVCGDYSYNKQKIWLYVKNIEGRLRNDPKYAAIPVQQALECMLAHEMFHSLHFMALYDACLANGLTMLKLFGYRNIFMLGLYTIQQKRKTIIESLAKSFECFYARDCGYTEYYEYESNNFMGKRKHYPAWPYAGAKGYIAQNAEAKFNTTLKASLDVLYGRGFLAAYDILDELNQSLYRKEAEIIGNFSN